MVTRTRTLALVCIAVSYPFQMSVTCANSPPIREQAIPEVVDGPDRNVTIEDITRIRNIDTASVSPDGKYFAILVRQGNPNSNEYRGSWFIGSTDGGRLVYAGDGGIVLPAVGQTGDIIGEVVGPESRWSPDGRSIAYLVRGNDGVQLWRSRLDGAIQEQLTRNAADVREFAWSDDSTTIYFETAESREEQRARELKRERTGYRYDEDLISFTDFMKPQMPRPHESLSIWAITPHDRKERHGTESDTLEFRRAQTRDAGGIETETGFMQSAVVPPVVRPDGGRAWLIRTSPVSRILRVVASLPDAASKAIQCAAEQCVGAIKRVWWSSDGQRVLIWRGEGIDDREQAFYSWLPSSGKVLTILRAPDDDLRSCNLVTDDHLVCIRETKVQPSHLVSVDLRAGAMRVIADVNPEFRNIRLGRVERYEWETPRLAWNEPGGELAGLYPKRAYGYILYPPDFDPSKKYPVFIEPYVAAGFSGSVGGEHALHVYAANGFVVLNMAFPWPTDESARLGRTIMKTLYSAELNFPHLTMLAESTVRGLDTALARGFIDEHRVGIGGVSHGTFVPLYLLQKHDRIAAISISSPTWGPHDYYVVTRKGRESNVQAHGKVGTEDWMVKPEGKGREFWNKIDTAEHVDAIKAPVLMQLAASETYALIRLIRHMADEGKPYDAYVFSNETHIKWQPAHLHAIMNRNLDWFRFWLQDYEAPDSNKAEQYRRWRALKDQQRPTARAADVDKS